MKPPHGFSAAVAFDSAHASGAEVMNDPAVTVMNSFAVLIEPLADPGWDAALLGPDEGVAAVPHGSPPWAARSAMGVGLDNFVQALIGVHRRW